MDRTSTFASLCRSDGDRICMCRWSVRHMVGSIAWLGWPPACFVGLLVVFFLVSVGKQRLLLESCSSVISDLTCGFVNLLCRLKRILVLVLVIIFPVEFPTSPKENTPNT